MTSLKPTSATSSGNTLIFLTSPVVINPGAYLERWNVQHVAAWPSGIQTLDLVLDQTFIISPGIAGNIRIKVDAIGNITSLKPTSATSSGNTLTFLTSPITINPGSYLGRWWVQNATGSFSQIQTVNLVPDQNYHVVPGVAGNIPVKVDAIGNIRSLKPTSATGSGSTLTFLTSPITINPGAYLGWWGISAVSNRASGIQTLNLVVDQNYHANPGLLGDIRFKVDAIGNVSSYKPTSATGTGNTLTFLTSSVTINPGAYLGGWAIHGVSVSWPVLGTQILDLVTDQRYQLQSLVPAGHGIFKVSPPCAIDFTQLIVGEHTFNISCGTPNHPPLALATVDPQIACAGASCPIILDGSGSTDPDSPAGTNLDIALFEWFANYGTANESYLGAGEVTSTSLTLGNHSLTLVVTDSNGATDTNTVNLVIDPAKLSLLDLEKVEIDWPEGAETLAQVKLHGRLALPVGLLHTQLTPNAVVRFDLAGVSDLFSEAVSFESIGAMVNKWEYKAKPTAAGLQGFKIHWQGTEYKYHGLIELKTEFIGVTETTFSIDRRGSNVSVTINVNGVDASIDSLGDVVTSVAYESDQDGEVTLTLPFELRPDMVIQLTVGTEPMKTLRVGDNYTPGNGKFEIRAQINPGALTGDSRPANLDMHLALGAEGFPGSVGVSELQWFKLSDKEWKAKLTN